MTFDASLVIVVVVDVGQQAETINLLTEAQLSSVGRLLDMYLVMSENEQKATLWELLRSVCAVGCCRASMRV
jgi:hypothetical protein